MDRDIYPNFEYFVVAVVAVVDGRDYDVWRHLLTWKRPSGILCGNGRRKFGRKLVWLWVDRCVWVERQEGMPVHDLVEYGGMVYTNSHGRWPFGTGTVLLFELRIKSSTLFSSWSSNIPGNTILGVLTMMSKRIAGWSLITIHPNPLCGTFSIVSKAGLGIPSRILTKLRVDFCKSG